MGCCAARESGADKKTIVDGDGEEPPEEGGGGGGEDGDDYGEGGKKSGKKSAKQAAAAPVDTGPKCVICKIGKAKELAPEIDDDGESCQKWECVECGLYSMKPAFIEKWMKPDVPDMDRKRVIAMLKASKKRTNGTGTVALLPAHLEWKPNRRKSLLHHM